MADKTKVFLRADGNHLIGLGHVHRCLALAEILRKHFDCHFIMTAPLPGIAKLIHESGFGLIEVNQNNRGVEANFIVQSVLGGNEIVVLDGYEFVTEYQTTIKSKGSKLVSIDDIHTFRFVADAVINHSGGVVPQEYKDTSSRLYLGPEYVILKTPFLQASKKQIKRSGAAHLLICLGGSDPTNRTMDVLEKCLQFDFESFQAIVGEGYRHREMLQARAESAGKKVTISSNLSPVQMLQAMEQCSVAVCSASGVAYEYLCAGGELYVLLTADNQHHLYDYLIEEGLAFSFNDFRSAESAKAKQQLEKQREVFDGRSPERLLRIFDELDYDLHGVIRRALPSDLMTLFEWANEPETRRQSYNTDPIPLDQHTKWFNHKLKDPNSMIYLIEYKEQPVGQVRIEIGHEAIISLVIGSRFQGRGFGSWMLGKCISQFRKDYTAPVPLVGFVKKDNQASSRIFSKLGFASSEATEHKNSYKYKLDGDGTGNRR